MGGEEAAQSGARARLIVRLVGGLGNQMFGYAAALRLARVNGAELVIDAASGFANDITYRRSYALAPFALRARLATPAERLAPLSRLRWKLLRLAARRKPFEARRLLSQERMDFDSRLLAVRFTGTRYIEGVWPGEGYFADIAEEVRASFAFRSEAAPDVRGPPLAARGEAVPVALHVRFFDKAGAGGGQNAPLDYYRRAIAEVRRRVAAPHFIIFSDQPAEAAGALALEPGSFSLASAPEDDPHGVADHARMRRCHHFVIANSTFSWWGAWMGSHPGKIVIAPGVETVPAANWNIEGILPDRWLKL